MKTTRGAKKSLQVVHRALCVSYQNRDWFKSPLTTVAIWIACGSLKENKQFSCVKNHWSSKRQRIWSGKLKQVTGMTEIPSESQIDIWIGCSHSILYLKLSSVKYFSQVWQPELKSTPAFDEAAAHLRTDSKKYGGPLQFDTGTSPVLYTTSDTSKIQLLKLYLQAEVPL